MKNIIFFLAIVGVTFFCPLFVESEEKESSKNSEKPIIFKSENFESISSDASACKSDSNGYTYFKVGDEVFRYKNDSPIKIIRVKSKSNEKSDSNGVNNGCRDSPFIDVVLGYNYKIDDANFKKIKIHRISVGFFSSDYHPSIKVGGSFFESSYENFVKNKMPCEKLNKNLEKCVWPNKDDSKLWSRVYKVDVGVRNINSYVECRSFVGDVECHSEARLYPTFKIYYAFFLSENPNWNEVYIADFEGYIRSTFETMRVSKD